MESKLNTKPSKQNFEKKEQAVREHDARELIGSMSEARIVLDNQTYLLRITKQNKLILTK